MNQDWIRYFFVCRSHEKELLRNMPADSIEIMMENGMYRSGIIIKVGKKQEKRYDL